MNAVQRLKHPEAAVSSAQHLQDRSSFVLFKRDVKHKRSVGGARGGRRSQPIRSRCQEVEERPFGKLVLLFKAKILSRITN